MRKQGVEDYYIHNIIAKNCYRTMAGWSGDSATGHRGLPAKEKDKKDYDDGGHLIANWFRGPNEAINIVPMRKSLNRNVTDPTIIDPTGKGAWLAMEREWANALKADKKVSVKIEVKYSNDRRPTGFVVNYKIGGVAATPKIFTN